MIKAEDCSSSRKFKSRAVSSVSFSISIYSWLDRISISLFPLFALLRRFFRFGSGIEFLFPSFLSARFQAELAN